MQNYSSSSRSESSRSGMSWVPGMSGTPGTKGRSERTDRLNLHDKSKSAVADLPSRDKLNDQDILPDHRSMQIDYEMGLIERQRQINQEIYEDNNGWNHYLEMIDAQIGERAAGLRWMHERCIAHFTFRFRLLGTILIIVQTGAATGAVTQISTCSPNVNVVTILVAVFMYIVAVLTGLNQFMNYGARAQNHQQAMTDFSSLEGMIRIELGKYRRDRKHGGDWTEWMGTRFDEVNASSPLIPGVIQKEYNTKILGKNVAANYTIDPVRVKGNTPSDNSSSSDMKPVRQSVASPGSDDTPPGSPEKVVPEREVVPLEVSDQEPGIVEDEQGDTIIHFTPVIERGRQRYELERFLRGQQ